MAEGGPEWAVKQQYMNMNITIRGTSSSLYLFFALEVKFGKKRFSIFVI
jgi:hypothetical protein